MVPGAQGDTAYGTAYTNAMERIEGQLADWARRAKQVLAWNSCAKRQLHKVELQHALGVEHEGLVLDLENCPRIEHLVSVCAGLVTVDEKNGIIRLVHYTAQEYFESTKARWFPEMELEMTVICTIYLSFNIFATGHCESDKEFEERLAEHRLYAYAAQNWGLHARAAKADDRVFSFLSRQAQVDAAGQALLASETSYNYEGYSQEVLHRTGLHLASYFCLVRAVAMIGDDQSVGVKNSIGQTCLHVATSGGHLDVAKLLIEKDADINAATNDGETSLHWALNNGHFDVVQLLLNKNNDSCRDDNLGCSLPFYAVLGGLEAFNILRDKEM
ncbi:hypothetical protein PG996_005233 [Apiospora saccharicola]|uniref:GPI inositol-deacylase winged helix domain-containing protein n=1 Tax=Apiospora saccharicola TaxID=335842 RepID=A0ABR1VNV3_9PEZI